jgi:NAD(P)H dehydrogenase (quinone)
MKEIRKVCKPKVAVIYYSSTGSVYDLAQAMSRGADGAGAETRIRQVPELGPASAVVSNPAWLTP